MDYQQFLFTITAGLQSACQAEEKITVQTIEQKHTAKIKTVSLYHRGKRTTPWIYMAPFYRLYQHGYSMESIQKELKISAVFLIFQGLRGAILPCVKGMIIGHRQINWKSRWHI